MRWVPLVLVLFGCDASFSDLRPDELAGPPDASVEVDAGAEVPDTGVPEADASIVVAPDAAVEPDASSSTEVARGTFEGRGGYDATGQVTLEHLGGDRYALVTSDDFSTASVPSPVLLVSDRDALGARLQPSDVRVATLGASQLRGTHRFELTLTSVPAYAWVYCEPFGVETARARLEAR